MTPSSTVLRIKAITEVRIVLEAVPEEHRGLSFNRTLSSVAMDEVSRKLELALAKTWARLNDPSRQRPVLVDILCREGSASESAPGLKRVRRRDQLVAASVIQWLGTTIGEAFLRKAFEEAGGSCIITYPSEK